jgi:hypothetical protein
MAAYKEPESRRQVHFDLTKEQFQSLQHKLIDDELRVADFGRAVIAAYLARDKRILEIISDYKKGGWGMNRNSIAAFKEIANLAQATAQYSQAKAYDDAFVCLDRLRVLSDEAAMHLVYERARDKGAQVKQFFKSDVMKNNN